MAETKPAQNPAPVVLFMSAWLLFSLRKAVALPGGEFSPDLLATMHFALDLVLTVLVLVLVIGLRGAPPGALRTAGYVVGPLGFAAGMAMLWIRLSSDVGWWTGHLNP